MLSCERQENPPNYGARPAAAAKSLQSCPTLCDPIDGSPPGSPVPGILQARTLEWVAISSSNAWKWKVKVKSLSRVRLLATPWTAAYQAPPSMGFSRQEYWSGLGNLGCRAQTWPAGYGSLTPSPAPLSVLHLPVGLSQWEAPSDNRRRVKEQRGPTHVQPAQVHEIVVESHCAHSSPLSSLWSPHSLYLFPPAVPISLY